MSSRSLQVDDDSKFLLQPGCCSDAEPAGSSEANQFGAAIIPWHFKRGAAKGAATALVLVACMGLLVMALQQQRGLRKVHVPAALGMYSGSQAAVERASVWMTANQTKHTPQARALANACDSSFSGAGNAQCFCQMARNAGCVNEGCECPQGCDNVWLDGRTATFENFAKAEACDGAATSLLTIPRPYFANIDAVLADCPMEARRLLSELLGFGFDRYQEMVQAGPVKQCVHAAGQVSVPWLHIHTFCPDGGMDGMWGAGGVGWCNVLSNRADLEANVESLIQWFHGGSLF